ncbi:MAG: hypothetical protein LBM87_02915 [Ruminococcus sp.]|jgi:hypothetical protein|nr:hypothetical protein [Ruminococcus sp.]
MTFSKLKQLLAVILCLTICIALTACGEDGDTPADGQTGEASYSGILTKVRIGMTETKLLTMMPDDVKVNYQSDYEIWGFNTDTEIQSLRDLIPLDDPYYSVDDSIITYYLKDSGVPDVKVLEGYMQEVYCTVPRNIAVEFYQSTVKALTDKYSAPSVGTMEGVEDIDQELNLTEVIDNPSFTITFNATYTYEEINGVSDYYGTHFSIKLMSKDVKTPLAPPSDLAGTSATDESTTTTTTTAAVE